MRAPKDGRYGGAESFGGCAANFYEGHCGLSEFPAVQREQFWAEMGVFPEGIINPWDIRHTEQVKVVAALVPLVENKGVAKAVFILRPDFQDEYIRIANDYWWEIRGTIFAKRRGGEQLHGFFPSDLSTRDGW